MLFRRALLQKQFQELLDGVAKFLYFLIRQEKPYYFLNLLIYMLQLAALAPVFRKYFAKLIPVFIQNLGHIVLEINRVWTISSHIVMTAKRHKATSLNSPHSAT